MAMTTTAPVARPPHHSHRLRTFALPLSFDIFCAISSPQVDYPGGRRDVGQATKCGPILLSPNSSSIVIFHIVRDNDGDPDHRLIVLSRKTIEAKNLFSR